MLLLLFDTRGRERSLRRVPVGFRRVRLYTDRVLVAVLIIRYLGTNSNNGRIDSTRRSDRRAGRIAAVE